MWWDLMGCCLVQSWLIIAEPSMIGSSTKMSGWLVGWLVDWFHPWFSQGSQKLVLRCSWMSLLANSFSYLSQSNGVPHCCWWCFLWIMANWTWMVLIRLVGTTINEQQLQGRHHCAPNTQRSSFHSIESSAWPTIHDFSSRQAEQFGFFHELAAMVGLN